MSVPTTTSSTTSSTVAVTRVDRVRPVPHHAERAGPGESATAFEPGDFVLVAGTHFNSRLIRFGQKLRIPQQG